MKAYTVYEIDTRDWKLNTKDMIFFRKLDDALTEFNNRKNKYLSDKRWRIGNECNIGDIKTSDTSIYFWKRATPEFPKDNYAIYIKIDTLELQ